MFLTNKYANWYFNIIEKRRTFPHDGYTEKHHVIPKSLGGSNESDNLVRLTAKEHFICHLLLIKMTEGKDKIKMIFAAYCIQYLRSKYRPKIKINSILYQKLKEENSLAASIRSKERIISNETKAKISASKIGVPRSNELKAKLSIIAKNRSYSAETRAKMSVAHKNHSYEWLIGRKLSADHIKKISNAVRGRKQSQEHIDKRVKAHLGSKRSNETKAKISAAIMGKTKGRTKPKVTCPYCMKEGGKPAMIRYHFDKCKQKCVLLCPL